MRQQTVLELRVDFKYDLEDARKSAIGRIIKATGRWIKPGRHGRATCTFLVVTSETSTEFLSRMRPTLEQADGVDNFWCHIAPQIAVSRHGGLDPYVTWLDAAWKKARERHYPENVRQSQPFRRVSKGGV